MLRYMLDTNVPIYLMREAIGGMLRGKINRLAEKICFSSVTYMELAYGVEFGDSPRNQRALDDFAELVKLLDYDKDAAAHTGEIRAQLRRAGKPIGPYDSMIAGHARSKGLALVTSNVAEFSRVPGLQCEDWLAS
jgi:tRNA(fMet)-specific endonuclease VapC